MKAIANPVEVEYGVIEKIVSQNADTTVTVLVNWGDHSDMQVLTMGMLARYVPKVGDYFVRQSDGYEYVNPKDVFERKYHKAE